MGIIISSLSTGLIGMALSYVTQYFLNKQYEKEGLIPIALIISGIIPVACTVLQYLIFGITIDTLTVAFTSLVIVLVTKSIFINKYKDKRGN